MTLMNIVDSVFYLGLVITFLLILLVVYHFKNRVTTMEQRCDTMFEIMNNIVQELNILRRQHKMSMGDGNQVNIPTSTNGDYTSEQRELYEYNQEDEESNQRVVELSDDINEDEPLKQIQISENVPVSEGTQSSLMEIDDNNSIKIEKVETNLENESSEENDSDPKMDSYKSMTNSALKAMVIDKGLSTNPSKLKKSELLDLLRELE